MLATAFSPILSNARSNVTGGTCIYADPTVAKARADVLQYLTF